MIFANFVVFKDGQFVFRKPFQKEEFWSFLCESELKFKPC